MNTQYIETLIIGAGQAGLSTGYHLRRRGRPLLIVDANAPHRRQLAAAVGHPAALHAGEVRQAARAAVPGGPLALPAARTRSATTWNGTRCTSTFRCGPAPGWTRLEARPDGGYLATVGDGTISCDNVVVATGTFGRTPNVPAFAAELDPSIQQLHSSQYRRPAQLQPGPVLVVGASHSGLDIAYELAESRQTILCGPTAATSRSAPSPGGLTCSCRWPCSPSGTC